MRVDASEDELLEEPLLAVLELPELIVLELPELELTENVAVVEEKLRVSSTKSS
jgi:hypothetical protein